MKVLHAWHLKASGVASRYSPWWLILLIVEQRCLGFLPFHFHFYIPLSSILDHAFWYWVLACVSWWPTMYHHIKANLHNPYSITHIGIGPWLGPYVISWWPTMYHHIRAYLHHPYSIMHIGIGSWLGPYVVSWWPTMYHHIRAYLHHPYSFTHIGIGSWLGPCVLSWWLTIISKHTSITHTQSHVLVLGLGLGHVLFHDNWPCNITSSSIVHSQSYIYVYMYIHVYTPIYTYVYMKKNQYPIPNSQKGYQKIPFLLTSCQNTDL